jgi:hypothetical protein
MAYVYFNPNSNGDKLTDHSVRAISKVLGKEWEDVYIGLCAVGHSHKDMPSSPYSIETFMKEKGFEKKAISFSYPRCTTVKKFSEENSKGRILLITENYIVALVDGDYYDIYDSGNEEVIYYYSEVR